MRYLKKYKIFESIDILYDIEDIFLEVSDKKWLVNVYESKYVLERWVDRNGIEMPSHISEEFSNPKTGEKYCVFIELDLTADQIENDYNNEYETRIDDNFEECIERTSTLLAMKYKIYHGQWGDYYNSGGEQITDYNNDLQYMGKDLYICSNEYLKIVYY